MTTACGHGAHSPRRSAVGACLALVVLAVGLPAEVAAQGDHPRPAPTIVVNSLTLKGLDHVSEDALRPVLATKAPGWLPWSDKPAFSREDFEADLHRIRAFCVDRGFPDAEVVSFDIQMNAAGNGVDLTVKVNEGRPTLVTDVRLEGFQAVPDRRLRYLRRRLLPVKPGQPLDRAAVATAREMLADELREHGYPYPHVAARIEQGADEYELTITLTAEPGELARFGETGIEGEATVDESVIRRSMLFAPGDLYRQSAIQETQRKLYDLELFNFVNVAPVRQPEPAAGADVHTVPMRVILTEGKHRRLSFSVGYGTEEKARAEAEYRRLNFLGGGRSVGVRGKWSSLDRGIRADFLQPFLFGPRWSLSLNAQRWDTNDPLARSIESGGYGTLIYGPGLQTSFSLTATGFYKSCRISTEGLEAALIDPSIRTLFIEIGCDPRTGGGDGQLNALSFDVRRNTAQPNPLNAFRGYALDVHLERAFPWLHGTYAYTNVSLDARHYLRLRPGRRLVLATRAQAGSINPDGGLDGNVPFDRRYFLGGSTSIRGWGRYEVSPLSGYGYAIGGFSMFQATVEARFRIAGQLGAVLFVDGGNVWENPWHFHLNDLRYAVGPGLRYNTPVGPVRVDVGYQLNPIAGLVTSDGTPQDRRWRLHFSIGQAF
ncbi:MAG: bamA 1 [Acidobacteria bacterium]|nr:bamA 1 [Acidobacteriota bacterium]